MKSHDMATDRVREMDGGIGVDMTPAIDRGDIYQYRPN